MKSAHLAPKLALGSQLSADDRKHVLCAFVHRFTGQHKPDWANFLRPDGTVYPLQFADDADWLAHTRFAVLTSGAIDRRYHDCISDPTFPNNPELRRQSAA